MAKKRTRIEWSALELRIKAALARGEESFSVRYAWLRANDWRAHARGGGKGPYPDAVLNKLAAKYKLDFWAIGNEYVFADVSHLQGIPA